MTCGYSDEGTQVEAIGRKKSLLSGLLQVTRA